MTLKEYQKELRNRVVDRNPKNGEYSIRCLHYSVISKAKKNNVTEDYLLYFNEFKKWFYNEQTSYKLTKIKRKDRETSMSVTLYDNKIEFIPNAIRYCLDGFKYIKKPYYNKESDTHYIGVISNFVSKSTNHSLLVKVEDVRNVKLAQLVAAKLQLLVTNKIIDSMYKNGFASNELRENLLKDHSNKFLEATKDYTVKDHLLAEEYIEVNSLALDIDARASNGYCDYIKKLKNVYIEIDE